MKGTAPSLSITVDAATNRVQWPMSYDAAGNVTAMPSLTLSYDAENRLAQAVHTSYGTEQYGYAPDNKRVWKKGPVGTETLYFWGAEGQRLMTYTLAVQGTAVVLSNGRKSVYFGGRMLMSEGVMVTADRLGSVRKREGGSGSKYYPWGEEQAATGGDTDKFATYYRDGATGLDYAQNRYYSSVYGRFTSADPYLSTGGAADPQSWNRYAYVENDPVNWLDSTGLNKQAPLQPQRYDSITVFGYLSQVDYMFLLFFAGEGGMGWGSSFANSGSGVAPDPGVGGAGTATPNWLLALLPGMKTRAIDSGMAKLKPDSGNLDCLNLFNVGGRGVAPDLLLRKLANGGSAYGEILYRDLYDNSRSAIIEPMNNLPGVSPPAGVYITLNGGPNSNWILGTENDRAIVILHELAHAYDLIWGPGSSGLLDESLAKNKEELKQISSKNSALIKGEFRLCSGSWREHATIPGCKIVNCIGEFWGSRPRGT